MSKKKKTYKVSNKPKVAAMNEYIYTDLKKDLAKKYKVNRPYKPGKIKKTQRMKGVTVRKMTTADKVYDKFQRQGGKRGAFSYIGKNRPMPTSIPKGIDAKKVTIENRKANIGIGQPGPSRYLDSPSESQIKVKRQKVKVKIDKDPLKGYGGKSSPINQKYIKQASKPMSATAKKALLTRGARVAVKGASRLIPGVGTALLVKDVYDVAKWASKQPKSKKKDKIYGTSITKSYKYNR